MAEEKHTSLAKNFGMSTWAVNNGTTVMVLTVLILIFGFMAFVLMPREALPEVAAPQVFVSTVYPGAAPADVEKYVTDPLEKELNGVLDLKEIKSVSMSGISFVMVEFTFNITSEEALRRVQDKVNTAKGSTDWPKDLPADPLLKELNISELMPVLNINLSGNYTVEQLYNFADDLQEDIEQITEISKADIIGAEENELEVAVDLAKMESLQISFSDIENAIKMENIDVSAGDIRQGKVRRSLRVVGLYRNVEEIRNTIVKRDNQQVVYLKDIAEVQFKEPEKKSYARLDGQPVVMLDVMKRSGENIIGTIEKINTTIGDAKAHYLPEDLNVYITNDMSVSVATMVTDLQNSIILGMIFVIAVLMFFMGFRNALFVGIAIPMSMFLSFAVLGSMGVTLNNMVLFGLVMALGMLVDNGIVVVENVYRLMDEEGMDARSATKQGTAEVAWPIISSTLTTLAAFMPLGLWPGIMGEFMFWLPMTLMIVLLSSLFVALVIVPMLTSKYMKVSKSKEKIVSSKKLRKTTFIMAILGTVLVALSYMADSPVLRVLGNLLLAGVVLGWLYKFVLEPGAYWFQNKLMPRLEEKYAKILHVALRGRNVYKFFFGTLGLLILSFILFGLLPPKTVFFPETEPSQMYIYVDEPIGTDLEVTDEFIREIEERVTSMLDERYSPEKYGADSTEIALSGASGKNFLIKSVIGQSGTGSGNPSDGYVLGDTPHKGKISVEAVETKYRHGVNTFEVMEQIRTELKDYPGVKIVVDKGQDGPSAGMPINIEIIGEDYDAVLTKANELIVFIESTPIQGIEKLTLDVDEGLPELPVYVDRAKAQRLNVSTGQIGDLLRTALYGKDVSTYKIGDDDYDINVRLAEKYRYNSGTLLGQKVTFKDPSTGHIAQVPISSIVTAENTSTFSTVNHIDRKRVVTVRSNALEGYNANEIVQQIKEELKNFELPRDMSVRFTGEQEDIEENMNFLIIALSVAVLLIFMIMVAQFNSASLPFIILTTMVLSLIGVLMGLVAFQMDFVVVMTMIGIIALCGVVVNNGIVLVDCAQLEMENRRVQLGLPEQTLPPMEDIYESIVYAGKTRLRPVLLTAITTVLGMVPLAIGMNFNFMTLFVNYDPEWFVGGENVGMWGPIAWTMIFGLSFATFLTLIIVPVMMDILFRIKVKVQARRIASQRDE